MRGGGRFVSGRTGIDVTMRFHRAAAILLLLFVLLHPLAFLAPTLLTDPAAGWQRLLRLFTAERMTSGTIAWIALLATVALALRPPPLPLRAVAPLPRHHWRGSPPRRRRITRWQSGCIPSPPGCSGCGWPARWGRCCCCCGPGVEAVAAGGRWPPGGGGASPRPRLLGLRIAGPVPPYRAGQFFWLGFGRAAPWDDNPFSVASAPGETELRFVIHEAGDRTRQMKDLAPGTPMRLDGPHGAFTLDHAGPGPILLVAGGAGIAPILSLVRALDAEADPRPVALLHGARSADRLVCRQETAAIAARRGWRTLYLSEEDAPEGVAQGVMTPERLATLLAGWHPAGNHRHDLRPRADDDGGGASISRRWVCPPAALCMNCSTMPEILSRGEVALRRRIRLLLAAVAAGVLLFALRAALV